MCSKTSRSNSCTTEALSNSESKCDGDEIITSYCIGKDKLIHGIISEGNSCQVTSQKFENDSFNILKIESGASFEIVDDIFQVDFETELYKLLSVKCDDDGNCSFGTDEHIVVNVNKYEISFNLSEGKTQNKKLGTEIRTGCSDIDSDGDNDFTASSIACIKSDTITDYCIHSDRFIYGITVTGTSCKLTNEPFTEDSYNNVVQIGTPIFKMVDLSTTDISSKLDKLFIVNCNDDGNCSRGAGKVIDSTGNSYEISLYEIENKKIGMIINDSCIVSNFATSDETACNNSDTITEYCIGIDNLIHGITGEGNLCKVTSQAFIDGSINILKIESSRKFEKIDVSQIDIEEEGLLYKLIIVKCDFSGNCSRGTDVIIDGTGNFYEISEDVTQNRKFVLDIKNSCIAGTISNPESVCKSTETITSYCIQDKIIHGIKEGSDGSCIVAGTFEDGSTNILKIESSKKFNKINVSKVNIEVEDLLYKLLIIDCDSSGNCSRGTGEVIDSTGNSYAILFYDIGNKKRSITDTADCTIEENKDHEQCKTETVDCSLEENKDHEQCKTETVDCSLEENKDHEQCKTETVDCSLEENKDHEQCKTETVDCSLEENKDHEQCKTETIDCTLEENKDHEQCKTETIDCTLEENKDHEQCKTETIDCTLEENKDHEQCKTETVDCSLEENKDHEQCKTETIDCSLEENKDHEQCKTETIDCSLERK
ncbi:hypothetical protein BCR32DRAFT_271068 [Anaeromyces robustus]|uniref:Uncharacterized protein n=1 Tax=Anaeromyces robustus TaxID=1754192 RepID=A0A1Y1WTE1_9FUNG|nr:hypothetical protein BCR32DRAFT_271068 [Anaeromyces robustus]|eukprot:ORX76797.1 hypothetical protein BCR32DRAFT_271068 [Anaeromyces robustus]